MPQGRLDPPSIQLLAHAKNNLNPAQHSRAVSQRDEGDERAYVAAKLS